jgi:OOP family OmpA-OmpF porin
VIIPEAPTAIEKAIVEKGRATLNVEFKFDKADIQAKSHEELERFAAVMQKYPDLKVTIEGHTDNVGGAKYNEKLSQKRAESVKKYLVDRFGIAASRLTAKGYGLTKPIADNKTAAGRQKNRRVEAVADYEFTK